MGVVLRLMSSPDDHELADYDLEDEHDETATATYGERARLVSRGYVFSGAHGLLVF